MDEEDTDLRQDSLGQFIEFLIDLCQESVFAGLIQRSEKLLGIGTLRDGQIAVEQVLGIICIFAVYLHIAGHGHAEQHGIGEGGLQAGKLLLTQIFEQIESLHIAGNALQGLRQFILIF